MSHRRKRLVSFLLALILVLQMCPSLPVFAASSFEDHTPGDTLFQGEEGIDRQFVSETAYTLAPGVTEYVTYTNEPSGLNQNIDYFCEIDLSKAEIMTGYAGMENILEDQSISWRMQTVSDQVKDTQNYFSRSEDYADATIVAALNADYYNMATGQPSGILMIDGVTYNPHSGSYYFAIDKEGKALISNSADLSNLEYAVAGGTLLVKDGQVNVGAGGRNVTYTAIGIKADGTVVSMVCYGQRYPVSCGYTQYEVAQMMKARGCQTALLLDGSGSSTFVSRREGDSGVITRNNPSDGQERQVSSSIFIISRVKADGIFAHAAVSPANEVYTPGSTVQFTATGADQSGAPAPLPEDLSWTVDAAYGTIDGKTGRFISNGKTGDVTVSVSSGGQVVGTATITIANPDQILFAEKTASLGDGGTSNLGLQVFYQQREVHYRDGDLTWTITPTQYSRRQWTGSGNVYETIVETAESSPDQMQYLSVGTVSNNQLTCDPVYSGKNTNSNVPSDHMLNDVEKTASAITATVQVSSKANPQISGTVTLEACKEPGVALDFEQEELGSSKIYHGLTTDGANDFYGHFVDGTYVPVTSTDAGAIQKGDAYYIESDSVKEMGYDLACLSYINRQNNTQIGTASVVSAKDGYPVRFGEQSLKIDYDIPGNPSMNDGVCFGFTEEIDLSELGNPTRVGIWVYIPKGTPNLWLRLRYRDGSGNTSQVNFTEAEIWKPNNIARNADDNWHYFEADISHLQTPVSIPAGMAIRVMYLTVQQMSNNAWGSPQGWVRCATDSNGNILMVDRDDPRLTNFSGGPFSGVNLTSGNYGPIPGEDGLYTLPTGDVVDIGTQLPIPEYLFTGDTSNFEEQKLQGSLYFDNLTYVYGSTPEDTTAPKLNSVKVMAGGGSQVNLTTGMTLDSGALDIEALFSDSTEEDANNTGVSSASLYVDNRMIENAVTDSESLRAGVKLANGQHTIRIRVVDGYGNTTEREYTVTINDPDASAAAMEVIAQEGSAVLGKTVSLTFTPRDSSVDSLEAAVTLDAAYAKNVQLTAAEGCQITAEPSYNAASETLTFQVSGSVTSGPMATLTLHIPTTASAGTRFTCRVNGVAGSESFNSTISLAVTAPYTVTSGQMVAGMGDTCYFQITDTGTGVPVAGVGLYQGDTRLGTSDENGRISYTAQSGQGPVTVTARDGEGNVSASYTTAIYTPQGNADGTPTHVWRNAADTADSFNVSWMANPLYAGKTAQLRLAQSEAALASAAPVEAECQLITFTDHNAAYVCGAKVTDLTPGTTYYYQVGDGTHWSKAASFTTGYANTGINALIFGDVQESNNENLPAILKELELKNYDLAIQTGDLVDSGSSYAYWDSAMTMTEPLDMTRLFAVGNHEIGTVDTHTVLYNQENSTYYTAQVGNVFLATIAYGGLSRANLDQLVADANASDATWKILVTHEPAYYTNVTAGMDGSTQKAVTEACQAAGIDVVLSGHDHSYARTEPLLDGQVVDNNVGITYFICGSLGDKGYTVSDTMGFHFVQATNDYNALYMTLSTTDSALNIDVYDYNNGTISKMDSFTKTKGDDTHTHSYTWDGASLLTCECGYSLPADTYTGYAAYTTKAGKSGTVYLNAGKLMTGVFAVGEDTVHHAGEDGLLHEAETVNSAQCWEDGYLGCWCHDCNTFYQLSATRRQGHLYDENHVCTRKVFNMDTFTYEVCGHQGKDISTLDMKLAYQYGFYTGEARRPAVTITDTLPDGTIYELKPQSTYGDYMPYWENNMDVGTATVHIEGYSDGPYYGSATLTFQIVPQNVDEEDFTVTTTSNSANVTWKPAAGATKYIFYQMVNGAWTRLGIVDEPAYTVTGLAQGSYQFMIRPFATVDGVDYYSTKNSDPVTVEIQGGGITFQENGTVTKTYGDAAFTNAASLGEATDGFTYTSANPEVATVAAETGEVTIVGAGTTVITAAKGETTGQYRLTVAPKEVVLTWSGTETRAYDGQPANVTAAVSGLIGDDVANVIVTGGSEKNAGTHTATAVMDNANYALPEGGTVQYTITPRVISSLVWEGMELSYTGQPLAPTARTDDADLVEGDTVEFTVPKATEVGTYVVAAASANPNYVVTEATENRTCTFTISMPEISLSGADAEQVTWYLDGTTIRLSGLVSSDTSEVTVTVTATLSGGSGATATSTSVTAGGQSSVTLGSVTYSVDATDLAVQPTDVTLRAGATQPTILDLGLEEADQTAVENAANASENRFWNILAAIAPNVEEIVEQSLAGLETKPQSVQLEISMKLVVQAYTAGSSYKVELTPVFQVTTGEGENQEVLYSGTLPNDQIAAPVEVSLLVPDSITLDSSTFVHHQRSNGRTEYIRPDITGRVLTFRTNSFSTFEVISDSRSASVTFDFGDGGTQTRIYTPENLGQALPTVTVSENERFDGWRIQGQVYTELTDALLTALDGVEGVTAEAVITDTTPPPTPGGSGGSVSTGYAVMVENTSNGTVKASATANVKEGDTVTLTVTPKEGYTLSKLTVTDDAGKAVTVSKKGNTEYTFQMPAADVTVKAVFVSLSELPFTDVEGHWALDAIQYVYENGMMNGTTTTKFGPETQLTRGMIVTILYRMEGEPAVSGSAFSDVKSSQYYAAPIAWAAEHDIVTGYTNGTFGPEDSVTREQLAAILYRYASYKGYDVAVGQEHLNAFSDVAQISSYATQAMNWAVGEQLLNGVTATTLKPRGTATRAQVATMLMRFCENIAK